MTDIVYNKNGIPFDIDAIATDVNGKMDRDCLNYSATGASVMGSMAMPDYQNGIGVTNASNFTPSKDGFFIGFVKGNYSNITIYIVEGSNDRVIYQTAPDNNAANATSSVVIPFCKDITYRVVADTTNLRYLQLIFYPLKGANIT